MKLRDMYGNLIAGKGPVLNVQLPSNLIVTRERDPRSVQMEQNVANQMQKAIDSVTPVSKKLPQPENKIRIVSYEEAVKELANTLKSTYNKT